jgi:hemoglobin/transferrin/lactoferrin receptor protein
MKKIYLLGMLLGFYSHAFAQKNTPMADTTALGQVVISANKTAERKADLPNQIEVVTAAQIASLSPQTTADALQNTGGVFVQKSQQGGGSPVLRGFEANKILLVVDGVRMNNAIFRSGHLQNIVTMDPAALDRIEVLYGAGSVIYGTDAIGGVVSMFTKSPELSESDKTKATVGAFVRYATANEGSTAHLNLNLGGKKWANYLAVTGNDFGDLRSGKKDIKDYPGFGDRPFYVERINGRDSSFVNDKPDVQVQSAYRQIDILEKLLLAPGGAFRHTFNVQYSNSTDVPRYDRLTEVASGKPRFAEWYYGPQKRFLASYQLQWDAELGWADQVRITPAYQVVQESRNDRRFGRNTRNERVEDVKIGSINLDIVKAIRKHEVRYGAEMYYNRLESEGVVRNIDTDAESPLQSRYPDGSYRTAGVYASHRWNILGSKLVLTDGIRYSHVNMDVTFDPAFFKIAELRQLQQSSGSVNYNLGLASNLPGGLRVAAMLSSGFRNPNIDDAGKVFENANGSLTLPNADLKPEQVLHREVSLGYRLGSRLDIGVTAFSSSLTDAIALRATTYQGQSFVVYGSDTLLAVRNVNVAKATVQGISASATLSFARYFRFRGTVSYTEGRDKTANVPLDHIPPLVANARLGWQKGNWGAETDVLLNGWKRIADYSPSGEDNAQYATPDGMPAWQTWNVRADWRFAPNWRVRAAVENILDLNYRVFASGINAAGRNFVVGLHYGGW